LTQPNYHYRSRLRRFNIESL